MHGQGLYRDGGLGYLSSLEKCQHGSFMGYSRLSCKCELVTIMSNI
jgi:hypothetical protein